MTTSFEDILAGPRKALADQAEVVVVDAQAILREGRRRRALRRQRRRVATGIALAVAASLAFWARGGTDDATPKPTAIAAEPTTPRMAPVATSTAAATTADEPRPDPPRAAPKPALAPTAAPVTWRDHWNAGRRDDAIGTLTAAGLEADMAGAPPDTILALAHHARSSGRADLTHAALRLLRKRHPKTRAASVAAIHLGRSHARAGDDASAREMFRSYLTEQPSGPLAREARGRLLEIAIANGNRASIERAAREYLAHHPGGPHARRARASLKGGP